ncbi:MAG TPA: tRNA (adenosine(37)-N6)-threonylcarbamoyltransferase complex transferase subunit TsaD [Armatimonadota bacterium]|jgi:N6-L-threonylcarbamoyladenine synthase
MLILGIETSCDETSVAVVRDGREILSNVISSQADLHALYGGVVPEIASRRHVETINPALQEALKVAGVEWGDLSAVAVTHRPGLVGALLVGVAAAKSVAFARGIPLVGVHHLEGHLFANLLADPSLEMPFLCLIVSGGHSDIVLAHAYGRYDILGRTRDDAAGEAFDKVARLLGLEYPGGPNVQRAAEGGNPTAYAFPRADLDGSLDFSFSGLKTSVLRTMQKEPSAPIADVAASFQAAVVDVLVAKTMRAAEMTGLKTVAMGGGVAANGPLRAAMRAAGEERGLRVLWPPPILCTDNAAMIAAAGYFRLMAHGPDTLSLETEATCSLAQVCPANAMAGLAGAPL